MLMKNNGKIVGVCPHCGAEVAEREKGWFCTNRECRFVIWKDNAFFKRLGKHITGQLVDKLLRDGRALEAKAGRGLVAALLIFVGIPLPGTGAWTGTLAGSILDMKFKDVLVACMGGVLLAGVIIGLASAGLLGAFSALFAV